MCPPRVFVGSKWGEGTEGEGTVKERGREEVGHALEYALLCSLIALVAMGAVGIVGRTVHDVFWQAIVQNF